MQKDGGPGLEVGRTWPALLCVFFLCCDASVSAAAAIPVANELQMSLAIVP